MENIQQIICKRFRSDLYTEYTDNDNACEGSVQDDRLRDHSEFVNATV